MKTFNTVLNQIFQDGSFDIMFASEYAEPGYTAPEKGILFADWNDRDHYDPETKTRVKDDDTMSRLAKLAEQAGYAVEWSDEWAQCDDCGKAVRTSPDSYGWKRSYFDSEDGIQCIDCVQDDPSAYLEWLEGNSRKAETMDLDLHAHGYVLVGKDYEHGWHPGQNDSPDVVAKSLKARGVSRFVFKIDDVGQFDVRFSVYVHEDEMELVNDAPVESALPYDPGTEMGKALRGEHSDVYHVETKQISQAAIQACPKTSFDPKHYTADGTSCLCPKGKS